MIEKSDIIRHDETARTPLLNTVHARAQAFGGWLAGKYPDYTEDFISISDRVDTEVQYTSIGDYNELVCIAELEPYGSNTVMEEFLLFSNGIPKLQAHVRAVMAEEAERIRKVDTIDEDDERMQYILESYVVDEIAKEYLVYEVIDGPYPELIGFWKVQTMSSTEVGSAKRVEFQEVYERVSRWI